MMCKRCHGDGFEYQIDSDGFCETCGSNVLWKYGKPEPKPQEMRIRYASYGKNQHMIRNMIQQIVEFKNSNPEFMKISVEVFDAKENNDLKKENERLREALEKTTKYLNEHIATLPCRSRQRELSQEDWEHLMFLRDNIDKALGGGE